jgi:hypothetical protein
MGRLARWLHRFVVQPAGFRRYLNVTWACDAA